MNRILFGLVLGLLVVCGARAADSLELGNERVRVVWKQVAGGWMLGRVQVKVDGRWRSFGRASGEYTLLYSAEKPSVGAGEVVRTNTGVVFPEPVYKYQTKTGSRRSVRWR
ncbi:hypothetical protein ACQ86N_29210 [Puia sp. P3]|uniref:hypothetical protein n=1 Tax=Puia sp. P3 TaxID=3423952 RepID=UPI003D66D3E8